MAAMELRQDRVYLVESVQDQTVKLALGTHVFHGELRWFDTVRGRSKRGILVADGPSELVWQSLDGPRYRFTPLTLERYNKDIRHRVEQSPSFPSVDELNRFYVRQFGPMIGLPPPAPPAPPPPTLVEKPKGKTVTTSKSRGPGKKK